MRVIALAAVLFLLSVSAGWGGAGLVSRSAAPKTPASYVKTRWRATVAKLPANAATGKERDVEVRSISCASPGNCAAVGAYARTGGGQFGGPLEGLLLTETAGQWEPGVEAVVPANADSAGYVTVDSVSCASAGNCTAVGVYFPTSGGTGGLLLTEKHGRWAAGVEALLPTNDPHPEKDSASLSSVSCASAGNCTAVGTYGYGYGQESGLVLTEKSGHWARGVKAPLPSDAGANQSQLELRSVSCASDGTCGAVGTYNFIEGRQDAAGEGMLLTNVGGTWRAVTAVMPPDGPGEGSILTSVSCARGGNCGAIGLYNINLDGESYPEGVLLTEKAGVWRRGVRARPPADANLPNYVDPLGISCPSPGNCGAVGDYAAIRGRGVALFSQVAGTWRTGVEPVLPYASGAPDANAISCASPGNCTVVGSYYGPASSGNTSGLLLTELGGRWARGVQAPLSAYSVSSVSCSAPGDCGAVGADVQGKAILLDSTTGASLGWSRSRGGPAILAYHFGGVPAGASASRWLRLWNPRSTPSGKLALTLTGSPAFSITSDRCAGQSIDPNHSCWVRVAYAPPSAGASDSARLQATGDHGAEATLGLSGCTPGASPGRVYWVNSGDGSVKEVSPDGGCVTTIATGQDDPVALAADATHVYWLDPRDGTVNAMPVGGGAVTILATRQLAPKSLAVDGTHVFWVDIERRGNGTVKEVSVDGGTVKTLARNQVYPSSVAVEGKYVYWTDSGIGDALPGTVNKVPVGGGAVTTLATDGTGPSSLAVDGTHVYWTSFGTCCGFNTGTVKEVPLGGGTATTLASGQTDPGSVAVDGTHVYWTTWAPFRRFTPAVKEVPLGGGAVTTLTPGGGGYFSSLAVDGTHVFLIGPGGETVKAVPAGGGAATIIASRQFGPVWVAVGP